MMNGSFASPRLRSERGEVASWLIVCAALAAIAMGLSPTLTPIFERLASQVGGDELATVVAGPSDSPSTAGINGDTDGTGASDSGLGDSASDSSTPLGLDTGTPPGGTGTGGGTGNGAPPDDAAQLLTQVTDLVDNGDDLGISEGELDDIQELFESMSTEELDWVLANMSDEQLQRLFHNVHSTGFWSNDWNDQERRDFYENLLRVGQEGDPDTWIRLGEFSPKIDPDPTLALPDSASEDETKQEYYDGLTWGPLTDPAFADGIDPDFTDPRQGSVGDCYLIAGLIALAHEDPELIRDLIDENPNGSYTVTFGDGHQEVVSPTQAIDAAGQPAFAQGVNGGSWPTLIEKAYAQRYGGWGTDPGITSGQVSTAIERLTGRESSWIDDSDVTMESLVERFENGDNLGISTIDRPDDMNADEWFADPDTPSIFSNVDTDGNPVGTYDRLHQNHAFVIVDVDGDAGTVSVLNPWNPSKAPLEIGFDVLSDSINGIYVNEGVGG